MKKDLESELREALRPVAPSADFTRRLIAQMEAKSAAAAAPPRARPLARQLWWVSGLAASLVIALGVQQHLRAQRELANGLEARRQVLQALHMTSQKLDLAYEAVKHQSSSLVDTESGA
jgi:acyl carrier protein phosphodiesterase